MTWPFVTKLGQNRTGPCLPRRTGSQPVGRVVAWIASAPETGGSPRTRERAEVIVPHIRSLDALHLGTALGRIVEVSVEGSTRYGAGLP